MLLPSVPLFLLLSLLPAVALLVLGRWGLAYAESRTTLAILSLALGAGLLFISLISAGSYSLQALQGGRESRWLLAITSCSVRQRHRGHGQGSFGRSPAACARSLSRPGSALLRGHVFRSVGGM